MERKLAAIFSTDVQGYSRLMGDNEEATIRTLTAYRAIMTQLIQQHRGRVVDTPGDNLLAEFASAVDAVQAAVEIQHELRARNTNLPANRQMHYRIGLNVGDVVVEGERLYGDGVNIAARIESLAEGGGVSISGTVYDQVKNKLALSYTSQGEQSVKNIVEPVRVWRVVMDEAAAALAAAQATLRPARHIQEPGEGGAGLQSPPSDALGRQKRGRFLARLPHPAALAGIGLLLLAGGIVGVQYLSVRPPASSTKIPPEQTTALPLPDKPSIAVLPFVNMSEDPQQEYFSDGMTEDLITALSKLSGLFIISRNSVFTYKGKAVKVADVSKELGVRYVLEGSVRKADNHVRVTAQLVDATTDHHIWAERYDRPLQDIFAVQDEIVRQIVTTLKLQLTLQEQGILVRKTTDNLEAYDYYLRGTELIWRRTKEANAQARLMFEKAVALDPQYAAAYEGIGSTYSLDWGLQWDRTPQVLARAEEVLQKAIALDNGLPGPHSILGQIYLQKLQHDQALAEAERAIVLDPNWADGYAWLAFVLRWSGRAEEAVEMAKKAIRLNPRSPAFYQLALGISYCQVGRYEDAITAHKEAIVRNPNLVAPHACLAACFSMAGREEEARAQVKEILRISPNYSLEVVGVAPWKNPADGKAMLDALRKAGRK